MPELKLASGTRALHAILTEAQLAPSRSEAERLIKQGAVEVNGEIEKDVKRAVELKVGEALPLRVGKKKFLKLIGI